MQNIANFYINGEWVTPAGQETHRLINPASEAEICKIPMGNERDVDAAVAAAKATNRSFFASWYISSSPYLGCEFEWVTSCRHRR